jgi:CHAT domain-containing protein
MKDLLKEAISQKTTKQLKSTLAKLKNNFKAEQHQKDMEAANKVYRVLINQIENELKSRK